MSLVSKILEKWIQLDDRILKPMSNFHPEIFPTLNSKSGLLMWVNSLVEPFKARISAFVNLRRLTQF